MILYNAAIEHTHRIQYYLSYSMRVQFNLDNQQKISLAKTIQNHQSRSNVLAPPKNHITIETPQIHHQINPKKKRRKIFQKFQNQIINKSSNKQQNMLRRVASDTSLFHKNNISSNLSVEERIEEINRELKMRRALDCSRNIDTKQEASRQECTNWVALEQTIAESGKMLRRQEELLWSKMPVFEQKIEANSNAINEVSKLIKCKMEEDSRRMTVIIKEIDKREEKVRDEQREVERVSTALLQKEEEVLRGRKENRRKDLQLQRIKRIQQLQNTNMQLYQQCSNLKGLDTFEDLKEEYQDNQCWEPRQFAGDKISKISYKGGSIEQNTTIGELLSPLSLNQNKHPY